MAKPAPLCTCKLLMSSYCQVLNFKKRYGAAPCSHMDERWARPERFVVSASD